MSRFTQIDQAAQGSELALIYAEIIKEGLGTDKPISWFTSQGQRPDMLKPIWEMSKAILLRGQLPITLKHMIALKVSLINECAYCSSLYNRALVAGGVATELVDCISEDLTLSKVPPSQRAVLRFAIKSSTHPHSMTDDDFNELRELGFSEGEITEILFTTGFANFLNFWADLSGIRAEGDKVNV